MTNVPTISTDSLRKKLSLAEPVNILDIRPAAERAEWSIPGSISIDVYDRLKHRDATVFDHLDLDKSIPVVTVCGAGRTSLLAADLLRQKGYNAISLEGGMKGWSLAWNTAFQKFDVFELWQIRRTGKGCLSYIIASNGEAIIIDASVPPEVYLELIIQRRLKVKYIVETHIHADHLSRANELSKQLNVPVYLPFSDKIRFQYNPISADTVFHLGSIELRSIPTPGHTLESYSFYIENKVLFTGDTLFTNGVGRPDLKSSAEESREKARLLYRSLHRILSLPENVIVLPAHASEPVEFDNRMVQASIGGTAKNIAMLKMQEEEFVNSLLQKIPATPPNYLAIVEKNIAGSYEGIDPSDLEAGANRCAIS